MTDVLIFKIGEDIFLDFNKGYIDSGGLFHVKFSISKIEHRSESESRFKLIRLMLSELDIFVTCLSTFDCKSMLSLKDVIFEVSEIVGSFW